MSDSNLVLDDVFQSAQSHVSGLYGSESIITGGHSGTSSTIILLLGKEGHQKCLFLQRLAENYTDNSSNLKYKLPKIITKSELGTYLEKEPSLQRIWIPGQKHRGPGISKGQISCYLYNCTELVEIIKYFTTYLAENRNEVLRELLSILRPNSIEIFEEGIKKLKQLADNL